jgi:hypothetical protein
LKSNSATTVPELAYNLPRLRSHGLLHGSPRQSTHWHRGWRISSSASAAAASLSPGPGPRPGRAGVTVRGRTGSSGNGRLGSQSLPAAHLGIQVDTSWCTTAASCIHALAEMGTSRPGRASGGLRVGAPRALTVTETEAGRGPGPGRAANLNAAAAATFRRRCRVAAVSAHRDCTVTRDQRDPQLFSSARGSQQAPGV